jgi:hypothetical protein
MGLPMPFLIPAAAGVAAAIGITTTQLVITVLTTAAQVGLSYYQAEKAKQSARNASHQSFSQNISQGTVPRYAVLGLAPIGGVRAFFEASGTSLYMITLLSDDVIDRVDAFFVRDIECLVDGSNFVTTPPFNTANAKYVQFELHYGYVDQPVSPLLLSAFPGIWTVNHKLQGIAYLVTKVTQPPQAEWQTIFNGQIPEIKTLLRGSLVYDPRDPAQTATDTNTWKTSLDPALNLFYYFTSKKGFALSRSLFDISTFVAVANYSDQLLPQKAGGFRKRYEMGGVYSYDEDPADISQRMLDTFAGEPYVTPTGLIGLSCDGTDISTITITEDMVLDIEIEHAPGALYEYSSVKARFSSEYHAYSENVEEADPWIDDAVLARISRDIPFLFDLPYVFNHSQARRLMKKKMLRLNPAWTLNLVLDFNGIELFGERLFTLNYPLLGTVLMRIEAVTPDEQFGFAKINVRCSSVHPESLLWNAALEEGIAPAIAPITGDASAPMMPTNLNIVIGDTNPLGAFAGRAVVSWDAITVGHAQEVQWRNNSVTAYTTIVVAATDRAVALTGLVSGDSYDFRVRITDTKYGVSGWANLAFVAAPIAGTTTALQSVVAVPGVNFITASLKQSAAAAAGYVEVVALGQFQALTWTGSKIIPLAANQSTDVKITEGAGTYSVYARSIGINGDLSAVSGPVNVVIAAVISTGGSSGSSSGSNSGNGSVSANTTGAGSSGGSVNTSLY